MTTRNDALNKASKAIGSGKSNQMYDVEQVNIIGRGDLMKKVDNTNIKVMAKKLVAHYEKTQTRISKLSFEQVELLLELEASEYRDSAVKSAFQIASSNRPKGESFKVFSKTTAFIDINKGIKKLQTLNEVATAQIEADVIERDNSESLKNETIRAKNEQYKEWKKMKDDKERPRNPAEGMTQYVLDLTSFVGAVPGIQLLWEFGVKLTMGNLFAMTLNPFHRIAETWGSYNAVDWLVWGISSAQYYATYALAITFVLSTVLVTGEIIKSYVASLRKSQEQTAATASKVIAEEKEYHGVFLAEAGGKQGWCRRLTDTTFLANTARKMFSGLDSIGGTMHKYLFMIAQHADILFMAIGLVVAAASFVTAPTKALDTFRIAARMIVERMCSFGAIPLIAGTVFSRIACDWTVGTFVNMSVLEFSSTLLLLLSLRMGITLGVESKMHDIVLYTLTGADKILWAAGETGLRAYVSSIFQNVGWVGYVTSFFIYTINTKRTLHRIFKSLKQKGEGLMPPPTNIRNLAPRRKLYVDPSEIPKEEEEEEEEEMIDPSKIPELE